MLANILIIAVIAVIAGLCLKKVLAGLKGGGCEGCGGCACGGSCSGCNQCSGADQSIGRKAKK